MTSRARSPSGGTDRRNVGSAIPGGHRGHRAGAFTLIGADGAIHRESFEVGAGVLLWNDGGMTFLLQGAGSKADAIRLAGGVDR